MNKKQVIKWFGTRIAVAQALGIDNSTITRWGSVPPWHQKTIERITEGELKADMILPKERGEVRKVCFTMPIATFKNFKRYCKKNKSSMSRVISDLVENHIK